jgi:long-chain acyl-CoA synthetase
VTGTLSWERSYPPSLRGYRLERDDAPLPSPAGLAAACARQFGTRTAFTLSLPGGLETGLSFAEVDSLSDRFAAYLVHTLGIGAGEVVAIQLPNTLHYPVAVFGAWKAGAIVTNINPLYTPRELMAQLADSRARVLVATGLTPADTLAAAQSACGLQVVMAGLWEFFPPPVAAALKEKLGGDAGRPDWPTFTEALERGAQHAPPAARAHDVAIYQFTGGTTGRSKGAILSHRNIASVLRMTDDFLAAHGSGFAASDTVLTALPLYHVFAFVINFLMFFGKGATNVLVPNPRPLANLQHAFARHPFTWMTGVDTLYAGLLAEPWFGEKPPRLKNAISGGTALRPSTARQWRERVSPILEGYGLTESSCIVACNPPGAQRDGSVGLPMPGSEVRVVDAAGRDVAPGETGELLVRGPHVTRGYLGQEAETAAAFVDGWFRTGDLVAMDADGYITIRDRLKDMVLVSGFNVYPNEVEGVIAAHPGVAEVAVIGIPDPGTGEAVCAYVARRDPALAAEDLIAHCRGALAAYKVPKQVVFMQQLPKSAVGKILRAQLRAQGG